MLDYTNIWEECLDYWMENSQKAGETRAHRKRVTTTGWVEIKETTLPAYQLWSGFYWSHGNKECPRQTESKLCYILHVSDKLWTLSIYIWQHVSTTFRSIWHTLTKQATRKTSSPELNARERWDVPHLLHLWTCIML